MFDKQSILFDKDKNHNMYRVQNLLSYIVKQYIFTCRLKTHPTLNVLELKKKIENRLLVEKYLLLKNCEFEKNQKILGEYH